MVGQVLLVLQSEAVVILRLRNASKGVLKVLGAHFLEGTKEVKLR